MFELIIKDIFELLRQIYSDMDFNNLSNPKKTFSNKINNGLWICNSS